MQVKTIEKPQSTWELVLSNANTQAAKTSDTQNALFVIKKQSTPIDDIDKITQISHEDRSKNLEFPEKILYKPLKLCDYWDTIKKPVGICSGVMFCLGAFFKAGYPLLAFGALVSSAIASSVYLFRTFKHNYCVKKLKETYEKLTDEQKKTLKDDIEEYPGNSPNNLQYYLKCARKFLEDNEHKKFFNIKNEQNNLNKTHSITNSVEKTNSDDISEIMWNLEGKIDN